VELIQTQVNAVLPTLNKLKFDISMFDTAILSEAHKAKITQTIAYIQKNMTVGEVDIISNQLYDLLQRSETAFANEQEERKRREQEEKERIAREEAERKAQIECEKKAKEEAEHRAKEEKERREREERERIAKAEAERKAQIERERKEREKAERRAKEEKEAVEQRIKTEGGIMMFLGKSYYEITNYLSQNNLYCNKEERSNFGTIYFYLFSSIIWFCLRNFACQFGFHCGFVTVIAAVFPSSKPRL
jgi:cation transport ATPase